MYAMRHDDVLCLIQGLPTAAETAKTVAQTVTH